MKKTLMIISWLLYIFSAKAQKSIYDSYPVYKENDLGLTYSPTHSTFRIWAPTAERAQLIFPPALIPGHQEIVQMKKSANGTWVATVKRDIKGMFYSFNVFIGGKWMEQVPDPYAKAVGVNGKRAMVVDLKETNPPGWENDKSPPF